MRAFLWLFLCGLFVSFSVQAEPIREITIKGNARVEEETIRSYLNAGKGDDYTATDTSKTIKTLYGTGLFNHVEVKWDSGLLTIEVIENPIVNRIAFEGNDNLDEEKLQGEISLHSRAVYTSGKLQQDVKNILAIYRQTGRFLARVKPQIIQRDQNRVDVIYVVDEGEKTKIRSIRFVGNKKFNDRELRSTVRTRESAWWRFLTTSDVYDPDRLEVDKELLRRHYISHGYADFRVVSAVTELTRNKEAFHITFTVSEGVPYSFGNVDVKITADEPDIKRAELLEKLTLDRGQRFNGAEIEKNVDNLIDLIGTKGYAFLDVSPVIERNEETRTIDVVFDVRPGPRVYVNRIDIKGNTRTRENVIRRQMRFAEGDAFSSNKLQRSRDRLTFLGFFEDVDIARKETEFPDRMDLDVEVKEQSTGEFNIGAGFSSEEGALATADVRERNFLGKGQDILLSFSLSSLRQDFNFSFTEPWFLGQELAAGIDLFNERRDFQTESSFDLANVGGGLRFTFPINEFTRNTVRTGFKETEINNVDGGASIFVQREEGKRSSFTVGNTYAIDTRDSFITPTHGHKLSLDIDYSGLGSDVNYLRSVLSGSWHKEIADEWIVSIGGRLGGIADIDGDLPIYEHFNAGGTTLRGFDRSGIGPRDIGSNDALGGVYMVGNNAELSFPLPILKDVGLSGLMFLDGGIVTEFEDDPAVIDTHIYRVSVGAGIFWRSPLGPLRFEFGFPLVKATEDQTQIFSFNFGTRF